MQVEGGLLLLQRVDGMDHALVADVAGSGRADPAHASTCAPFSSWAAGQLDACRDSRERPAARYRHQEPHGYLRYVAFLSRSALDVGNGEESRA